MSNTENNTTDPAPAVPDPVGGQTGDQMIPYARFKEVNDQKKTFEAELAQFRATTEAAQAADLVEQKKYQELAAGYKTKLEAAQLLATTERQARERLQVAQAAGLPLELADRVAGATLEEMQTDAAKLAAFVKPKTGPGVPPVAGASGRPGAFDLSKLNDPEYIRKNTAALIDAARRGEI